MQKMQVVKQPAFYFFVATGQQRAQPGAIN
jgi:hypothetical protein